MSQSQPQNKFSFDSAEFQDVDEPESSAEQTLAELDQQDEDEQEMSDEDILADVDLRLEMADLYRSISDFQFADMTSPGAQRVATEMRLFVRERLQVMLGLRAPKVEAPVLPFDDDEIKALRLLAGKVLHRPALLSENVSVAPTPPPRRSVPEIVPPKPPARASRPAPSKKPVVTPAVEAAKARSAKPQRSRLGRDPLVEKKTAPKSAPPAPKAPEPQPPSQSQTYISTSGQAVTLVEGEIIRENGRTYKVKVNDMGTLYKADVTGQVRPPPNMMLQPMSPIEMEMASRTHAAEQLARSEEVTGVAVAVSLATEQ